MTTSMKTLALALSLALPGLAQAATAADLPRDLPPYGADKPLPVAQIAKKTLANGLEVWVVPRDGIPRVDYVLAMRDAGYGADAADAQGFASLFASLLAEGTATRDSRAIAETAQSYGGSVGASASNDGVLVYAGALTRHAASMLELLAEIVRSPSFPDDEVRLAQANALQALKAAEAQPSFRATRALLAATYGDHPYARTQQTEASIGAVTPAALRQAHGLRFHPDRALLVVTGRIEPAEGFRLAEAAFGNWEVAGAEAPETPAARREAEPSRVLLQRDGSVQATLRIGRPAIPATDPDYVPAILAGTVLGGGFSSRVNQNLREDKGYTYGASAGFSPARTGGRVQAGADVRNEVTGAALQEFFGEFRRLAEEPVPEQELLDTKRYVAGGYLISNQLQGAVASTLASNWLLGLPSDFLASYVPRIREVDAAQLQAIARKYFDPKDQSIIVVGDGAAIADQLKPYGEFRSAD
ncbi:M16 family metallopeptidase [Luteimonas sp. SDU82]|uniref:M16 family metallopeptidase n=1 Tax=Luteimonas sp. SDU82 TaxID=3422592 RepID=UPI003EB6FEE4